MKFGFGAAAGLLALIPVMALDADVFDSGNVGFGILMAARGVGALIGPFLGHRIAGPGHRRLFPAIGLSLAVFGLGYMAMGQAPSLAIAAVTICVAHLGGGSQWMLSTYGLQVLVPDHIRGRIFGFDYMLITLSLSVSALIASAVADQIGAPDHRHHPRRRRARVGARVVRAQPRRPQDRARRLRRSRSPTPDPNAIPSIS